MGKVLNIYKKGEIDPITSGDETTATITGLAPETVVADGDYQAAFVDGTQISDKVNVPGFTVLPAPKPATGIKFQGTMALKVGDTKKATLSADPIDADNADAVVAATTYKSSDETIATVAADGTITAVAVGAATITAKSGSFTGDCKVTVAAAS